MIMEQCVCFADCISFQLATFYIFIELRSELNLKHVPYHEKLIMWNRWGGITRLFQMGVSPVGWLQQGQVFTDNRKKITM